MPSRTWRRKSRKRKPSSRKKSSRKRSRRCVSHPRANALSSDEDYMLESEENSSDSDGSVASFLDEGTEEKKDEDEEEEEKAISVNARNAAQSFTRSVQQGTSRPRRQRKKPNSSDEDFNVDIESNANDDGSAREGHLIPPSARIRHDCTRNSVDTVDFVVDVEWSSVQQHASRPARVHHRRRKQNSSDEDFEMPIEKGLDNMGRTDEGAGATRPVTRAMEAGQGSDSFAASLGTKSVQLKGISTKERLDHLPIVNSKTREPSLSSSAGGASTIDKDTAANKRKGKEKVLEGEEPTSSKFAAEAVVAMGTEDGAIAAVACGICLNETAVLERGKLECCDHFFCFVCIMEWAKVESRCPMCKQRFATVAKVGSGVSKRTRTIRIPLRDQVYIPPEDDLPFEDPYVDVVCMECHGTGDEGLLLLCDRCDSAAHTFCVGLGRSVPRGDWYCRDCQALTGDNSGSENEAEELVLVSDSEEDEDFLIQSIVASENQPRRQRRRQRTVQRAPVSTTGPSSQPRRTLGAGERRRLWRRLSSRRGSNRRVVTAPQLSQTARTFLSSITAELNTVSGGSDALQSGSARTVPQQRRLQERVIAMRNNWGRIQNGDMQFDAIRTPGAIQPTVLPSRIATPTSATGSASINRVDVDSTETSMHGEHDVEQAWRMFGQARNLSAGTSSNGVHQRRPVLPHNNIPTSSSPWQNPRLTASTLIRTASFLPSASQISDKLTHVVSPQRSGSYDADIKRGPKEHPEALSGHGKGCTDLLVLSAGEKKQENLSSSRATALVDVHVDSCGTSHLAGGQSAADAAKSVSHNREKMAVTQGSKPQAVQPGRHNMGRTYNPTVNAADKEGVSRAKESSVSKSSFFPPHEGLKVHLTELVKKQTWPVYIAERLDKEQFKKIARAAVHSLLALCDPSNKSLSLSCPHLEDQGKNPLVNCCTNCLDQHVEGAVRTAKDKIVPH